MGSQDDEDIDAMSMVEFRPHPFATTFLVNELQLFRRKRAGALLMRVEAEVMVIVLIDCASHRDEEG